MNANSRKTGLIVATLIVVGGVLWFSLIRPMSDPPTTSSVIAPTQNEPENLANPGPPDGGSKP